MGVQRDDLPAVGKRPQRIGYELAARAYTIRSMKQGRGLTYEYTTHRRYCSWCSAPISVAHELADRTLYFYSYTDVGKEGAYSDDTTRYLKWCGSRA